MKCNCYCYNDTTLSSPVLIIITKASIADPWAQNDLLPDIKLSNWTGATPGFAFQTHDNKINAAQVWLLEREFDPDGFATKCGGWGPEALRGIH